MAREAPKDPKPPAKPPAEKPPRIDRPDLLVHLERDLKPTDTKRDKR